MTNPYVGTWHIYEMELWNEDYFNTERQAYVTVGPDLVGEFQFGLISGQMDCMIDNELDVLAFSWEGIDEMEPMFGSGWIRLKGPNEVDGKIIIHLGDRSGFKARRAG